MEHIRIKSIKREACDFGLDKNMCNNNLSQSKLNSENMETTKDSNGYFGQNGYSGDSKYGKWTLTIL